MKYRILHNNIKIAISTIGKSIVKNVLNISFEGAKNLMSLSFINQSNDRKASDGEPKISIEPKICTKLSGNFKLNEYAEAISCK